MKVALYARVSKEDGQTPENQLDILRQLAERRGYEIYKEYIDKASGKDANRPAFSDMMAAASKHEFDAIMAVRLDRIMRSLRNLDDTMQKLAVYNVSLIFSDMELDLKTPNGRLQMNLISAIAQWEREMISARTKEGLASRKARGKQLGKKQRELPLLDIANKRIEGWGWRKISETYDIPRTTLRDHQGEIDAVVRFLKPADNLPTEICRADKEGGI